MRNARIVIALMLLAIPAISQTYDPKLFGGMHWRNIGPFAADVFWLWRGFPAIRRHTISAPLRAGCGNQATAG